MLQPLWSKPPHQANKLHRHRGRADPTSMVDMCTLELDKMKDREQPKFAKLDWQIVVGKLCRKGGCDVLSSAAECFSTEVCQQFCSAGA
eukprot:5711775-Amphidinium_carterae.1